MELTDLTIFELPLLSEEDAWAGVRDKLNEFPELNDIYDNVFLSKLVAGRKTSTSLLLLRLVRTDELARQFWRTVLDEMRMIGYSRARDAFAEKMRRDEPGNLESWTTELAVAAWLESQRIGVTLDPDVGNRKAEFLASTVPPTTWEIKTPADSARQRSEQRALRELQRLLRNLPTPVSLSIEEPGGITFAEVPRVVKEIKRRLAGLDLEGDAFPCRLEVDGLELSVYKSSSERGYLGSFMSSMQELGDEHRLRVAKIIRDAARQLPSNGAGVIVIDGSFADWITDTSIADACFGADELTVGAAGQMWPDRTADGAFNPKQNRRISAVLFYSRRFVRDDGGAVCAFYNPYARVPLPDDWLPDKSVRHGRLYTSGPAKAVRVKGPAGLTEI